MGRFENLKMDWAIFKSINFQILTSFLSLRRRHHLLTFFDRIINTTHEVES